MVGGEDQIISIMKMTARCGAECCGLPEVPSIDNNKRCSGNKASVGGQGRDV